MAWPHRPPPSLGWVGGNLSAPRDGSGIEAREEGLRVATARPVLQSTPNTVAGVEELKVTMLLVCVGVKSLLTPNFPLLNLP